jgi:hypothetical protein
MPGWEGILLSSMGSAVLLLACYVLGSMNYSLIWVMGMVGLSALKSYMWKEREKRLIALRETAMREREVITAQLTDLPAWVCLSRRFPYH